MSRARLAATLAALLMSGPAVAGDGQLMAANLGGYTSEPRESLDSFITRVAEVGQFQMDRFNAEVCGQITRKGDVYGIVLQTNGSQILCYSDKANVLPGHELTGMTFHTHPPADADGIMRFTEETKRTAHLTGMGGINAQRVAPGFSGIDYDGGPGYVLEDGSLLFQEGRGTDRVVSTR